MKTAAKTAIITGGASGIGFHAAKDLAKQGYHIIIGVRNLQKGKDAASKILNEFKSAEVDVLPLDVSDTFSIREFFGLVVQTYGSVDILINNAGVMAVGRTLTNDGNDYEMSTNFLGPFLLTQLLLPYINNTGRIVNITSDEYEKVQSGDIPEFGLFERKPEIDPMRWYGISKLYVLIFTLYLHNYLQKSGSQVICVAAHPGLAGTDLASNIPSPLTRFFMKLGMKIMGQSPQKAAQSFIHATLSKEVKGGELWAPGGFGGMRGAPVSKDIHPIALDKKLAEQVWFEADQLHKNVKFS